MAEAIVRAYRHRIVLISPPRTSSTAVARLLWEHPQVQYHCHEPFEAQYWGEHGAESVSENLCNPMVVATGTRVPLSEVPPGSGVLLKEMCFQLDIEQFIALIGLASTPAMFIVRDPVLCVASRLRVVRELYGQDSFPPFESGWQSLAEQLAACREHEMPYVILDSGDLRAHPEAMTAALLKALRLVPSHTVRRWQPRPSLHLCAPEVGSLMSVARATDDPFFRRVLSSDGLQPPDKIDLTEEEALIAVAGMADQVAEWAELHVRLREDPNFLVPDGR